MMFWQPIFLLAVIPTIITLASSLHFVVNQAPGSDGSRVVRIAIITLFGAAAYFTGRLSGNLGMVTVIVMFILVGLTLGAIS